MTQAGAGLSTELSPAEKLALLDDGTVLAIVSKEDKKKFWLALLLPRNDTTGPQALVLRTPTFHDPPAHLSTTPPCQTIRLIIREPIRD